jgi:hypothetical protein
LEKYPVASRVESKHQLRLEQSLMKFLRKMNLRNCTISQLLFAKYHYYDEI